jgi:hypothetical protein
MVKSGHRSFQNRPLFDRVPRLFSLVGFDIDQEPNLGHRHLTPMATFIFRCPNTKLRVQGWAADDPSDGDNAAFAPVECVVCRRLHYVNPASGRVLGAADDND